MFRSLREPGTTAPDRRTPRGTRGRRRWGGAALAAALLTSGAAAAVEAPSAPLRLAPSVAPDATDDPAAATDVRSGLRGTASVGQESDSGLWFVHLSEPPLAQYTGGIGSLKATAPATTGDDRLDVTTAASRAYRGHLASEQDDLTAMLSEELGRTVEVADSFQVSVNAVTVQLSAEEAAWVAELPGVSLVEPDREWAPDTDASVSLIEAEAVWTGETASGLPTRGEGVIVGMIDSGVNPDHPSFAATDGTATPTPTRMGPGTSSGSAPPTPPPPRTSATTN